MSFPKSYFLKLALTRRHDLKICLIVQLEKIKLNYKLCQIANRIEYCYAVIELRDAKIDQIALFENQQLFPGDLVRVKVLCVLLSLFAESLIKDKLQA